MADLVDSIRDGDSTAGTLGIGLGAIARHGRRTARLLAPGVRHRDRRDAVGRVGTAARVGRRRVAADRRRARLRRRVRRPRGRRATAGHALRRARPRPDRGDGRAVPSCPSSSPRRRAIPRPCSNVSTSAPATPAGRWSPSPSSTSAARPRPLRRHRQHLEHDPVRRAAARDGVVAGHRRAAATRHPRIRLSARRGRPGDPALGRADRSLGSWPTTRTSRAQAPVLIAATLLRDDAKRRDDAAVVVATGMMANMGDGKTADQTMAPRPSGWRRRSSARSSRRSRECSPSGGRLARWPRRSAWRARIRSGPRRRCPRCVAGCSTPAAR